MGVVVLRPAIESSVLSQFVKLNTNQYDLSWTDPPGELAPEKFELHLLRTHVLNWRWLHAVANSSWYRMAFFPCTLFLMLTVTVFRFQWMQNPFVLPPLIVFCGLMGLCSLTRMDRTLIRCLIRRFDWAYLCFVMCNFVIWNMLAQAEVYNIWYILSYVIVVTPMSLVLLHLDSVPRYAILVKIAMLICGITLTATVIIRDWIRFFAPSGDMSGGVPVVLPGLFSTTSQLLANQSAAEVCMYLIKNLYWTLTSMRMESWKNMTTLRTPLIIDTSSNYGTVGAVFKMNLTTCIDSYASIVKPTELQANYYGEHEMDVRYALEIRDVDCKIKTDFVSSKADGNLLQLTLPFRPLWNYATKWHEVGHWYHEHGRSSLVFLLMSCAPFLAFRVNYVSVPLSYLTFLASVAWLMVEGCTIDRKILKYLFSSFEVLVFVYQMVRVFVSQILLGNDAVLLALGAMWIIFNLATLCLDAWIFRSSHMKSLIVYFSILLSVLLLTGQRYNLGDEFGASSVGEATCFIDCASSQLRFFIALTRLLIFQFKYLVRILLWPRHCIILFIPLLYKVPY